MSERKEKRIILQSPLKNPPPYELCGKVRISEEAERIVKELAAESGLPVSKVVSTIIIQAVDLIDIEYRN